MSTKLYRGGENNKHEHQWWTTDPEYAAFYADGGEIHEIEARWGRTLDLREFGTELTPESAERFEQVIDEHRIPVPVDESDFWDGVDVYFLVEDDFFHQHVFQCGFRAIRVLQWHHEYSEEPVDCWFVYREAE